MQFKKIYIEITNLCNLRCSFCPPTKREGKILSVNDFDTILNKIKEHTKYIYLHVKGEPLSHPELDKIMASAYKLGIFVNITTNGTLINKHSYLLIKEFPPRQINFSLHSFDDNLNNINLNNYLTNIINFTKSSLEDKKTYISYRLWNYNSSESNNIKNAGNKEILATIQKEFNLDYDLSEVLIQGKSIKLADKLFLSSDFEFRWPTLSDESLGDNGTCHGLKDHVAILSNGTVVPCCLDGEGVINLGNILTEDFSTILNSERAVAIKKGFEKKLAVEELCKRCQFKCRF